MKPYRAALSAVLELIGLALIAFAAWELSRILGLFVVGAVITMVGFVVGGRRL